jgi:hypothetical protein
MFAFHDRRHRSGSRSVHSAVYRGCEPAWSWSPHQHAAVGDLPGAGGVLSLRLLAECGRTVNRLKGTRLLPRRGVGPRRRVGFAGSDLECALRRLIRPRQALARGAGGGREGDRGRPQLVPERVHRPRSRPDADREAGDMAGALDPRWNHMADSERLGFAKRRFYGVGDIWRRHNSRRAGRLADGPNPTRIVHPEIERDTPGSMLPRAPRLVRSDAYT